MCYLSLLVFFIYRFQPATCNGFHNVLMISIDLNSIPVLNIHGAGFCCITNVISKSEIINLLQNADLIEKSGTLSNIIF